MTQPMHTDGYSIAKAIDTAVAASAPTTRTVTANSTLIAADDGGTVIVNDASANTLTLPENVFEAGATVLVVNEGAGKVTVTAGSGLTLHIAPHGAGTVGAIIDQYDIATIVFLSATVAVVSGGQST